MPYLPHLRLSLIGSFRDGNGTAREQFTFTTSWGQPGGSSYAEAAIEGIMDDLSTSATAFWTDARLAMSARTTLDEVKLAAIGTDGKYPASAQAHVRSVNAAGHVAGAQNYPTQIACVVSLATGQRGGSRRGRFYLPAPSIGMSDLHFNPAAISDLQAACSETFLGGGSQGQNPAANIRACINQLGGGGIGGATLVVASSKGLATPVLEVKVGTVPDTVRRRRNKLAENYVG